MHFKSIQVILIAYISHICKLTYRAHATKCMFCFSQLSPGMSVLPLRKVIRNKLLVTCYQNNIGSATRVR